ncbi:MAG: homoserine kinase [Acidimicrobiia bacterium]
MAEATAPASAANLGAGFDTLALALELRCRVEAQIADDWQTNHLGPEVPPPEDADRVLEAARLATRNTRALSIVVRNEIPVGRGLGASAAAAVAGYAAAKRALDQAVSADQAQQAASELDGHADNAAASAFGGLVAVTVRGRARRLRIHSDLEVVVAVPEEPLPTDWARAVLSGHVDRGVAVRSIARVVAVVEGLRTADPGLLADAMGDELHEQPRSALRPEIEDVLAAARDAGAVFACWSGAGPSVLALAAGREQRDQVAKALSDHLGSAGQVIKPRVATEGLI